VSAKYFLSFKNSVLQLLELSVEGLIAKGKSSISARRNAASKLLEKVFRVRLGRGFYGECLVMFEELNVGKYIFFATCNKF
jgi:hypothetical protein